MDMLGLGQDQPQLYMREQDYGTKDSLRMPDNPGKWQVASGKWQVVQGVGRVHLKFLGL
jgi:hypothetical protein